MGWGTVVPPPTHTDGQQLPYEDWDTMVTALAQCQDNFEALDNSPQIDGVQAGYFGVSVPELGTAHWVRAGGVLGIPTALTVGTITAGVADANPFFIQTASQWLDIWAASFNIRATEGSDLVCNVVPTALIQDDITGIQFDLYFVTAGGGFVGSVQGSVGFDGWAE